MLATFIVSSRLQPIYESTAAVDVDRQAPSGVVGQDSNRLSVNDADQFLATQIKLIQSDSVLRPVAQKYKLLEQEGQISATRSGQSAADQQRSGAAETFESDRVRPTRTCC